MAKAKTSAPPPAPAKPAPVAAKPAPAASKAKIDPEVRRRMIAEAAYYIAEKRGFIHGHHDADWAEAERQIDAKLAK